MRPKIKPAAVINPPHVISHVLSPSQNEIADPRAQFNYLLQYCTRFWPHKSAQVKENADSKGAVHVH